MKTLLMTQFEVAHIADGHPMTVTTLDGEEFRMYCPSNVKDEGILNGLRNVPMGYDNFRTVAMGGTAHPILDFEEGDDYLVQVAVRLPTIDEWREMKNRARQWFEDNSLYYPDQPSEESQLWLITPLPASF